MSFNSRVGAAAAVYARSQYYDTLLRTRESAITDSLVRAILAENGQKDHRALATELAKVRQLRQILETLETSKASLENDVAELDRCISHKAWVYPEASVHGDLAKKAKLEAQLTVLNEKLAKIYSVNTKT